MIVELRHLVDAPRRIEAPWGVAEHVAAGDACRAQQHRCGRGVVVTVALLRLEEEVVHAIRAVRRGLDVQVVRDRDEEVADIQRFVVGSLLVDGERLREGAYALWQRFRQLEIGLRPFGVLLAGTAEVEWRRYGLQPGAYVAEVDSRRKVLPPRGEAHLDGAGGGRCGGQCLGGFVECSRQAAREERVSRSGDAELVRLWDAPAVVRLGGFLERNVLQVLSCFPSAAGIDRIGAGTPVRLGASHGEEQRVGEFRISLEAGLLVERYRLIFPA